MNGRIVGVIAALGSLSCTAPTVAVLRPATAVSNPCTAPPPREPARIFAGLESEPPRTEGNVRLVDYSVDDRLASPGYRHVLWGDAGRLLTVERDRVIVWEVATGAAIVSVRLPESVTSLGTCTAARDLSRAACIARVEDPPTSRSPVLLVIDTAKAEARLSGETGEGARPFAFADDGKTLIAGGDLWDVETWTRTRSVFAAPSSSFGKPLAHPRSGGLSNTMVDVTFVKPFPMRGPRLHERVLTFGPRLLQYREAALDVTSREEAAQFRPTPGHVTISTFDGAPDVRFPVEDPDTIVVLSPNGKWVGSLAREFTLRKTTSADTLALLDGTGWANRALLSDDGRVLVLGHQHHALQMSQEESSRSAKPSPDPHRLSPRLEAWDLARGVLLWRKEAPFPGGAILTRDGRFLWTPLQASVVDVPSGRVLTLDRRITSVSPEGVALTDDAWGGTTVLDLVAGRVVLAPHRRALVLAVSRAGHFATRSPDHSLQLETPTSCVRLLSPQEPFGLAFEQRSVAFSEDASTLVASTYRGGGSFLAWDADTGAQRYALRADGGRIEAVLPLREVRVVSTASYPTPLSPPDVVALDVKTGEFVSLEPFTPVADVRDAMIPSLDGKTTTTVLSDDRVYSVAANDEGELAIGHTGSGKVIGRAHFAERHDHVRFAWFSAPRRLAVQTARGGIFEFEFDAKN